MKKRSRVVAWLLMLALLALPTGCQTMSQHKIASGAAIAALAGAAAGAAIDKNKRKRGAAIGAVAGAAIGGGIGFYLKKRAERYQAIEDVDVQTYEPPADAGPPPANPTAPTAETTMPYVKLTVGAEVLFAKDSATLSATGAAKVAEVAAALREEQNSDIVVKGYTSSEGAEDYNQALSERRAEAVRAHLIAGGVAAGRIAAVGLGESNPVADNSTEYGRQQNRRVEIVVFPRQ